MSNVEFRVASISVSATIIVFCDAVIWVVFSIDATRTLTFARLKISTIVTTSISSEPFATGTKT